MNDDVDIAPEPDLDEAPVIGRAGRAWLALIQESEPEDLAKAMGLTWPFDPDGDDVAVWLALDDLGVRVASVIAEPRFKVKPEMAARDAMLGRDTMHLAPQWRYPMREADKTFGAERGEPALILPVAAIKGSPFSEVLSHDRLGAKQFAAAVDDLIALPTKGGRALSMIGFTLAVQPIRNENYLQRNLAESAARKHVTLRADGFAWLNSWLSSIRAITADTPGHLIEQLHFPFAPPAETLLVQARALEWRVTQFKCVIPTEVELINCPDSRALAEWIDAEMRKRERPRRMPVVCGPKQERAA